ncbi:hypothetical protein, variant [Phialophora macrospora]|uniref:Uncharacterized protein n=1 Tax=Phialophora macrospora TaxID=1851006 RepID=A0A0D2GDD6_9EURO|nr:hypothetical protein, variant [Phialophora macrospora]
MEFHRLVPAETSANSQVQFVNQKYLPCLATSRFLKHIPTLAQGTLTRALRKCESSLSNDGKISLSCSFRLSRDTCLKTAGAMERGSVSRGSDACRQKRWENGKDAYEPVWMLTT